MSFNTFFRKLRGRFSRPRIRRQPLRLEVLEDRNLLAVTGLTEFAVNATTAQDQENPAVAADAAGNYVVAWQSQGQDGSGFGIYARVFNAQGQALTGEIPVNQLTTGNQANPTVAVDADGDFAVAWDTDMPNTGTEVCIRLFNRLGQAVTNETLVNTNTAGDQRNPSAAIDPDGDIVVAWESSTETLVGGAPAYSEAILARRFNAAGAGQGNEFAVRGPVTRLASLTPTFGNEAPGTAMDLAGNFVVAWEESTATTVSRDVFFRRYAADGSARDAAPVAGNATTANSQESPAVAMDLVGNFVLVWESSGQDSGGKAIIGRRFTSQGTAASTEFLVNVTQAGDQKEPSVSVGTGGNFFVAWEGPDGTTAQEDRGVFLRQYSAAGDTLTSEVRINSDTLNSQGNVAIAANDFGTRVAAIWEDNLRDSSSSGVFGRRFQEPNVGDPWVVTSVDQGGPPRVRVYTPTGSLVREFDAYGAVFTGGVRVAVADVIGATAGTAPDGNPDILTAPGPGGAPFVNIFNGVNFNFTQQIQVYGTSFTLGVNLAVGNVRDDARPEIVVAPERGGEPFINVLDSQTGTLLRQFLAYGQAFTGGVRLALANTDAANGTLLEVLTAPEAGGAPFVNQFNAATAANTSAFVRQFQVYGDAFTGGLYLSAGNFNNTAVDDIVVGPGAGGAPFVNFFEGNSGAFFRQIQSYGDAFTAGVRVGTVDVNADALSDLLVGPGPGGTPAVNVFDGQSRARLALFSAYDANVTNGLFVVGVQR